MNRRAFLLILLFLGILVSGGAEAKPTVKCEVIKVSEHPLLITFEWRVSIFSDRAREGCDLRISFQDAKGQEIYFVKEVLKLQVGPNGFSGTEICDRDVWKKVVKYVTTLDCQF